ncbi:hypothetical protein G7Z17_g2902 [Cylindrodendrum hubeiense]|uniref:NAD-dependent epimerase/dehydratase domain-containing protein n=1 Tax=Cylindrodendrum hubeiense TaxID=595255 RepID=A0A9P5HHW0_9HYPO|nr:hypothetical protein G7Z17_g2902 [Cylindrodendrum hubeiense]
MSNPSQHILITGGAGFVGQDLAAALASSSDDLRLTLSDVVEPTIPKSVSQHASRISTVKCDLTDPSVIASLFKQPYTAVYLLHGLMSGGAEANLELGWRVNWDSHRGILDFLRLHHPGAVVVFPSSLAVYGPSNSEDPPTSETTCPIPQSSYGAQKLMVETYLNDMSRRGLLDGRIVRLPTIIVRPGAPSAAASSFASGIVREPLNGMETTLPVARDLKMWVCSPETVVKNLILIKDVPANRFNLTRVVNLPGISVTVQEILDALEAVGGKEAVSFIKEEKDAKVEAIVGSWPYKFDTRVAEELGMVPDVHLVQNVTTFSKRLQLGKE